MKKSINTVCSEEYQNKEVGVCGVRCAGSSIKSNFIYETTVHFQL